MPLLQIGGTTPMTKFLWWMDFAFQAGRQKRAILGPSSIPMMPELKEPEVIVTGNDRALQNALFQVFDDDPQILCL